MTTNAVHADDALASEVATLTATLQQAQQVAHLTRLPSPHSDPIIVLCALARARSVGGSVSISWLVGFRTGRGSRCAHPLLLPSMPSMYSVWKRPCGAGQCRPRKHAHDCAAVSMVGNWYHQINFMMTNVTVAHCILYTT